MPGRSAAPARRSSEVTVELRRGGQPVDITPLVGRLSQPLTALLPPPNTLYPAARPFSKDLARMARFLLRSALLVGAVALVPAVTAALAAVDVQTYRDLDQFMSVFERVRAEYVDKVDDKTLIKGAIDGMLASLDPHSSYLDARDFTEPARRRPTAPMAASA